ncbi:MAG: hypothetical protein Q9212_003490 [Teloschistes hypoglaucus]
MAMTPVHLLLLLLLFAVAALSTPTTLNLTTIAANARNESVLECWQLIAPFSVSNVPGTAGSATAQLGQAQSLSYTLIPPRFDGGLHNAPVVQYVAFTAGKAVISFPNSTAGATIRGGRNGLILAADVKSIPVADNKVPKHTVLYGGPCKRRELNTNV